MELKSEDKQKWSMKNIYVIIKHRLSSAQDLHFHEGWLGLENEADGTLSP